MFKNMMLGTTTTGPQGLMNHTGGVGDATFAPTGFTNSAALGGGQMGGAQTMNSAGVGGPNRPTNGIGDGMATSGF